MLFEEPKVDFVPVELEDVVTASNPGDPSGPEIHICGGVSFDDDCDPNKIGSL